MHLIYYILKSKKLEDFRGNFMADYTRCSECSCVFTSNLKKCPKCGKEQPITEESKPKEPIFNICD